MSCLRAVSRNLHRSTLKNLKVALIGAPNAGKSTLLNQLVNYKVSCVSNKVHTTRANILGVLTDEKNDIQIEFIDSPGIITRKHAARHSLEHTFVNDPREAVSSCDLITVLIDASNIREQRSLNKGVVNLLENYSHKKSVLILNKVDRIKEKRSLLTISTDLTSPLPSLPNQPEKPKDYIVYLDEKEQDRHLCEYEERKTWPHFERIFYISALRNEGVDELRKYLYEAAEPTEKWNYDRDFVTDLGLKTLTTSLVRGKYLDCLPKEIPYNLDYKYDRWQYDEFGTLHITLCINCPKSRQLSMVIGPKGATIGRITREMRIELSTLLNCDVALKLVAKPTKSTK